MKKDLSFLPNAFLIGSNLADKHPMVEDDPVEPLLYQSFSPLLFDLFDNFGR